MVHTVVRARAFWKSNRWRIQLRGRVGVLAKRGITIHYHHALATAKAGYGLLAPGYEAGFRQFRSHGQVQFCRQSDRLRIKDVEPAGETGRSQPKSHTGLAL